MSHRQQNKCYSPRCLLAHFKAHSILAVANLLAHNNISQICYCGQISLQSAAVNCSFSGNLAPLGVTFILMAVNRYTEVWHWRLPVGTHGFDSFFNCLSHWTGSVTSLFPSHIISVNLLSINRPKMKTTESLYTSVYKLS